MKIAQNAVLLAVVCSVLPVGSQEVAWTEKAHKKVILHPDNKWEFTPATGQADSLQPAGRAKAENGGIAAGQSSSQNGKVLVVQQLYDKGLLWGMQPKLLIVIGALFLVMVGVIAGVLIYFLVAQPRKKRKSLLNAFEIINGKVESHYDEAERLLTSAMGSGLKEQDLREAHFARAYVRIRLNKYEEALADLAESDQSDPGVAYLDLWLKVERKKFKEAYALYDQHENSLTAYLRAKELVSIACYNLGAEKWKDRDVERALTYFDKVRELGIHANRLPDSISDHQVTMGIRALFDGKAEVAQKYFEDAVERSTKENRSPLRAKLGLMLIAWCKSEHPQLEEELGLLVKEVEAEFSGKKMTVATGESGKSPKAEALSESGVLLRNVRLWHAVSLLHSWFALKNARDMTKNRRDAFSARLEKVRELDKDMVDPDLLLGLIEYYFFPEADRKSALERLERSKSEIPEIERIVQHEKKLAEQEKNKLKTFFSMVKEYVANHDVPVERKKELIARLEGYARFKHIAQELSLGDQTGVGGEMNLKSLNERQKLMARRITGIVLPRSASDKESKFIKDKMQSIEDTTKSVREQVGKIETEEFDLVVKTGEYLLRDESEPSFDKSKGPAPATAKIKSA